MPTFYNFKESSTGNNYSFDDIFVPANFFRQGNLWAWGYNGYYALGNSGVLATSTPITTFTGSSNWKKINCAETHVGAIKTDGTLWMWGKNTYGQLGINATTDRSTPVTTFAGGTNWVDITCDAECTGAIKADGTLWVWGSNRARIYNEVVGVRKRGHLGLREDKNNKLTPVTTFAGGTDWKKISNIYGMWAGIKYDGTLWTWGRSTGESILVSSWYYVHPRSVGFEQQSLSTPITTFTGGTTWRQPATVNPEDHYTIFTSKAFFAGVLRTSAATKTDGTLWVWGQDSDGFGIGFLGNAGRSRSQYEEVPVTTFSGGTTWVKLCVSGQNGAAIKTDGTLWVWGNSNNTGSAADTSFICSTPITTFSGGTNWRQVSFNQNGNYSVLATKTNGTLWVWGSNSELFPLGPSYGYIITFSTPITIFAGGTTWRSVSAGDGGAAAIKTDGTLWAWGNGSYLGNAGDYFGVVSTPVTTFSGGTTWRFVDAGFNVTAAVKTNGTLWMWGDANLLALGSSYQVTSYCSTPVTTFSGGTTWRQVSVARSHVAAVKTDGTLWTWGSNGYGQLGNASTEGFASTPITTFGGGTTWVEVAAGYNCTLALKNTGVLYCFGSREASRFGDAAGLLPEYPLPQEYGDLGNWKEAKISINTGMGIRNDGTLWVWGNRALRGLTELGAPPTTASPAYSTPVTTCVGGTNWKTFDLEGVIPFAAAIKTDGTLWTWSEDNLNYSEANYARNLDYGEKFTPVTLFSGSITWKQPSSDESEDLYTISSGNSGNSTNYYYSSAAISTNGSLWVWGYNASGTLGTNDTIAKSTPVTIFSGGTTWSQISSNPNMAIKTDGTLWVWGPNTSAKLGTNSTQTKITPVTTFAGGTNWRYCSSINVTNGFSGAIKTDGTLWVWGNNADAQLGTNSTQNKSTPVTTFTGGTNWRSIVFGATGNSAAIKTDGTLWLWGDNAFFQLGNFTTRDRSTPITTFSGGTTWRQVSLGLTHAAAVKTDGTLWTWGSGNSASLGINANVSRSSPITTFTGGTNWRQVSCGYYNTAAIKTDGTLWVWGNNADGKLGTNSTQTKSTPVTTFLGGTNWREVVCSPSSTIALKTDGSIWTFGNNYCGQLGTPSDFFRRGDICPIDGNNWKSVSLGYYNTAAIKSDATLWVWGSLVASGTAGVPSGSFSTPVTTFLGGKNWLQVSTSGAENLDIGPTQYGSKIIEAIQYIDYDS